MCVKNGKFAEPSASAQKQYLASCRELSHTFLEKENVQSWETFQL